MWKYLIGGYLALTVVPAVVTVAVPAAFRAASKAIRPKLRGVSGEAKVNRCLKKFKGKEFARARDVMFLVKGKTSQIDNLLVSPYGVFVIETKNYAGFVDGQKSNPSWQHIPPGRGNVRSFYNPIWQNNGHIKALREMFKDSYPNLKFYNVVAFSNKCSPPEIDGVVNFRDLHKFLKNKMKGQPVLSDKDVAEIKGILERNNIKDRGKRSEHVAFAKYTAGRAKEQERQEEIRRRAMENNEMAMRIQMLYSQGRPGGLSGKVEEKTVKEKEPLASQIRTAAGQTKTGASFEQESVRSKSVERIVASDPSSMGAKILAADVQKKVGASVEQVASRDMFFEL